MLLWLTCTHGRYRCLQRNLRCYLDQTFTGSSVMFICNSGAPLKLPAEFLSNISIQKHVYIDNCSLMNFQSVGEKYQHAITLAKKLFPKINTVTSADDDDVFIPSHLVNGVHGLNQAHLQDMRGYKPHQSYFRSRDSQGLEQISLQQNTFEPSMFIDADWILEHGYAPVSIRYHQQWLDLLLYENKLLISPEGIPTLIYNWGDNTTTADSWGIYKMSGSGTDNQQNFLAHARGSRDMGTGILVPAEDNSHYYNLIKNIRQ